MLALAAQRVIPVQCVGMQTLNNCIFTTWDKTQSIQVVNAQEPGTVLASSVQKTGYRA